MISPALANGASRNSPTSGTMGTGFIMGLSSFIFLIAGSTRRRRDGK
jgi:hypothetical protein